MIARAVETETHFNVIHLESMFKIDVFLAGRKGFEESELQRRQREIVRDIPQQIAYVVTPEDVILAKRDWYQRGSEASDRQ